jgi:hypothetical protein
MSTERPEDPVGPEEIERMAKRLGREKEARELIMALLAAIKRVAEGFTTWAGILRRARELGISFELDENLTPAEISRADYQASYWTAWAELLQAHVAAVFDETPGSSPDPIISQTGVNTPKERS